MSRIARWVVALAAVAAIGVLFIVLRPDDTPSPAGTSSPSPPPSPSAALPAGSPSGTAQAVEIGVEVAEGRVAGPGRVTVPQGSPVRLEVTSDVADEVHVHGYDLKADVAPGSPAVITFTADLAGIFEVELEDAGKLLLQLEVTT